MRMCTSFVANVGLVLLFAVMLAGCTRTLAFGTATKFGLDISLRADQTIDVSLGYDREEVAGIPAPYDDATDDASKGDTYSVLGTFKVKYGNPWMNQPLVLDQFFATGWAARKAAKNPSLSGFFGKRAGDIAAKKEGQ